MSLSVANLYFFPIVNYGNSNGLTGQHGAGAGATAPAFTYTNGVYTQSGTQYVAGLLDQQGINPARIFKCDNGTGSGSSGSTIPLPTLVSVTAVSANGQSIQELPSTTFETTPYTGYAGFVVILNPAPASADDGIYPTGFTNAIPPSYTNTPGWVSQGGAYTGTTTTGYPQPQMRFFVSIAAMLILASTSTG